MRRGGAFLLTSLVFLFFAEGQRAFFASLFALTYDAVHPAFDPGAAALAVLPLLALLVPFLPLARLLDRAGAITVAAAGVAVFRLPMAHPALVTRAVGSALVLAGFGLFLTWAVGWLDRRALSAGAVAGLVADQLLRLAGTGYDLALQPAWVPVQAALSLALLALAVAWGRSQDGREARPDIGGAPGLERRAGGLRLRGALALGPLLFLDLHLLGLPPVAARWTDLSYETAALAAAMAAGAALGLALAGYGPTRARPTVVGLVGGVVLALVAGWWWDAAAAGLLMAGGHGAALLLIARTLDPASGRRGRAVPAVVLGLLTVLTALYTVAFFTAPPAPLDPAAPWVIGAALALLAGAAVLLPGAASTPPTLRPAGGAAVAAGVVGAAALLLWLVVPPRPVQAPDPSGTAATGARAGAGASVGAGVSAGAGVQGRASDASGGPSLTVASGNARYGFDRGWRFDPGALAEAIAAPAPAAVALGAVAAAVPAAYGMDLTLWLERRLGARSEFAPSANGLLGRALLVRGSPAVAIHSAPSAGDERGAAWVAAWARGIAPGPALVLAPPGHDDAALAARLRDAGFRAVPTGGRGGGSDPRPAQPDHGAGHWLWVRGLAPTGVAVGPARGAAFDLFTASVHLAAEPVASPGRP